MYMCSPLDNRYVIANRSAIKFEMVPTSDVLVVLCKSLINKLCAYSIHILKADKSPNYI